MPDRCEFVPTWANGDYRARCFLLALAEQVKDAKAWSILDAAAEHLLRHNARRGSHVFTSLGAPSEVSSVAAIWLDLGE